MKLDRDAMVRDNRQISIRMEIWANRAVAQQGLTAVQANMLLYILRHSDQGTSLTAIHQEFGYSMAALSGLLKRLREKGYVRVERCEEDDRRKLLFGTEKGARAQKSLDRAICEIQDQLYSSFTPEELCTLDRLQKKMLHNLSKCTESKSKEVSPS